MESQPKREVVVEPVPRTHGNRYDLATAIEELVQRYYDQGYNLDRAYEGFLIFSRPKAISEDEQSPYIVKPVTQPRKD